MSFTTNFTTTSADLLNLIIFSQDEDYARELSAWASTVIGSGQIEICPPSSEVPLGLNEGVSLVCWDARWGNVELQSWPDEVLSRLPFLILAGEEQRELWQGALARYDWDLLPTSGLSCAFFQFAIQNRMRLEQSRYQFEQLTAKAQQENEWNTRALIRDRDLMRNSLHAQAEFLANMSHEIRTPLNTIIGMSDLLKDSHVHGVEKKHLEVIKKSSQALLALIENILDLSRLESGRLSFENHLFDVHELIEQCFDVVSARAHKNGIETTLDLDATLPRYISADRARLSQVLVNLFSNAAKFTEVGKITVRAYLSTSKPGSDSQLIVSVTDTGPGLSNDQLTRLYQAVQTSEPSMLKTQSGPGLGLLLARKFVEGMGGQLRIETRLNEGSTFEVEIPVGIEESICIDEPIRQDLSSLHGKRALVLDHHPESSEVTSKYLTAWGLQVDVCTQPAEFLSLLLHFQHSYELALIDYETAGPQLSMWLSQAVALPRELRLVIMLKSNTHAWSRVPRRKTALGVHHLLKPVKRSELQVLLKEVFSELFPHARLDNTIELLPRARANEDFRILVVDDSKDNRYLMQAFLRNSYHATWFAENGRMAVEMARDRRFHLIFMDLQMPEMDGITAIQHIRDNERRNGWAPSPIFALTAHVHKEERSRAFSAGCNDYLVKPVTKDVILNAIRKVREPERSAASQTFFEL